MKTARFSETLASINQSIRWLQPKVHHQNSVIWPFITNKLLGVAIWSTN
jgi:hypothetical protein